MIPQHSTNLAQTRLTSEIGRDWVLSGWFVHAMTVEGLLVLHIPKCQPRRSPTGITAPTWYGLLLCLSSSSAGNVPSALAKIWKPCYTAV